MKKKYAALIVLLLLVLPSSASALETDELIALTAMPLAVAAASELSDVPTSDLLSVISTLNRAAVPPTQFVEIVRYSPVALVTPAEPRFVTYVTTQYDRGIVGEPLALSIADQYPVYGVREVNVINPPVMTIVEQQTILPPVVVTRFQPVEFDPLALVAMPLAVAAVSEFTDVPRSDLINFIASMNRALVPAPQFVEVVRYSPVVLVDDTLRPQFMSFVTTEIDRGVIGSPLAFALADRIETFGIDEINIVQPPTAVIVDRDIVLPAIVTSRVADFRAHPHGGPPGQIKKDLGLQTGAEVVHGTRPSASRVARSRPAKSRSSNRIVVDDNRPRTTRVRREKPQRVDRPRVDRPSSGGKGKGKGRGQAVVMPSAPSSGPPAHAGGAQRQGQGNQGQGRGNQGQGNQGKGKGKGKG